MSEQVEHPPRVRAVLQNVLGQWAQRAGGHGKLFAQCPSEGNGFDEKYKGCGLSDNMLVVCLESVEFKILSARLTILGHF